MILPTYTLPGRKTVSNSLIPKLFQTTKERVQQLIAEADAICLTTDDWTSLNDVSYIALNAHFIDKDTALKYFLLGCTEFHERHTAENVSNLFNETIHWGIANKITEIITDNAANIVAAVHSTTWRHFPCFAHTLNLTVQHSLDAINEQLDKVKAIVQYFKHSSSSCIRLTAIQKQMNLPILELNQSVVTRWNSTYGMPDRLLKIKDAVVSALAIEKPRLNNLTLYEWTLLEKCVEILKIFYEVTVDMSTEKSVSISKVMVLVKIMKTQVERAISQSIENNTLATEAALLDPTHFYIRRNIISGLNSIKKKLRSLFVDEEPPPIPQTSSQLTNVNVWAEFEKEIEKEMVRNPTAASIIEIDKYLNEPLIKRTDDPLQWWNESRLLYPNLYILMKRRLCVPATSVPCERVFSKAGQVINTKRSSLKPEKASQVLFLQQNWT
ncbi:E3 SUMO-protein ligase ZBED1-like [Harmonia axyridis]|uniref:E3 SUMO-protein ligase ZBED1-like n=1 Tax=Harmonia axyridis TaxID=115357 RepID=UPI001E27675F|nr:E3 SUMO-protein ligase ZBED1-like [Harmonia axyridis]